MTISILAFLLEFYVSLNFVLQWRRWMTASYTSRRLMHSMHYKLALNTTGTDNPDQRTSEDIGGFISGTGAAGSYRNDGIYNYTIAAITTATNLVAFSIILWGISQTMDLPIFGLRIPGPLFWVAILYACFATGVMQLMDFANFVRAGLKELGGLGTDGWRAFRRGVPKGIERGAAQAGKALVVGGIATLMHTLGAISPRSEAWSRPMPRRILERMSDPPSETPAPNASPVDEHGDTEAEVPRAPAPRKPTTRRLHKTPVSKRGRDRRARHCRGSGSGGEVLRPVSAR